MKIATCRLPAGAPGTRQAPVVALDSWRIQFGDEVLLCADDEKWGGIVEHARRSGLEVQERASTVEKENLYLAVQIGRLFQQAHPDVPVILDKGRYLAVELDPARARKLIKGERLCYALRPIEESLMVFAVRSPAAQRVAPVDWIQDLVSRVSDSPLKDDLQKLVSFPTRHSTSEHYQDAAKWAQDTFSMMGYSTWREEVEIPLGSTRGGTHNVVAEKPGQGSGTRNLVVVVAHLDSINIRGGPSANAPGADDNGSGSAGLLEIARVLKDHPGVHDLRFVLCGGEEQGLYGSKQHVDRLPAGDRARVRAVVNMDMIGTLNTAIPTVLIEGATVSQAVIDGLADAAATYTQLTVQTSLNPFNSDHVPFIDNGLPAVLTIEGTDSANSNVHTAGDALSHIHSDLMLEILRMNVAFVAQALSG